ncbi:MAG TPA: hypothetical protein VFZ48_00610 [Candidatus Saccharimonadales bacterium]
MTIKVTDIQLVDNDVVSASFSDGHTMQFFVNIGGTHVPTRLEKVLLLKGQKEVVVFFSEYQQPVNYMPFGFPTVAKGYTLDRIVNYWNLARAFAHNLPNSDVNLNIWRVIRMGDQDFDDIRAGKWLLY